MIMTETPSKYYSKGEYVRSAEGGHPACPGCALTMGFRYLVMGVGEKAMFITCQGCNMVVHSRVEVIAQRDGGLLSPWLTGGFGATATIASGLKSALVARGDTETAVVVYAGDGAAFDIGFGGLSAAAERNEDILYVCYDNESYQNTGGQRSSAAPWGTVTSTNPFPAPKIDRKKAIAMIMANHRIPYAATATVAYPDDLIRKAQKARNMSGFRFLHILSPCPTGWRYLSQLTVKLSRLAVETKIFPLFEVENGTALTINKEPEGIPVEEYTKLQGRLRHLTPAQIANIQKDVDEEWKRLQFLATYK